VAALLVAQGVVHHPETGQEAGNANTIVFDFPQAAPKNSVFRGLPALTQLDSWLKVKKDWCDHNPSCTIYVREHEWLEVGAWVYRNWDWVGGLSFLPYDGGVYELAPYEEITEEDYKALTRNTTKIDWSLLSEYERNDNTEGAKTYACTGDKCEIF
jgi:ribonucleoside-diphosphate reductase alpha chain